MIKQEMNQNETIINLLNTRFDDMNKRIDDLKAEMKDVKKMNDNHHINCFYRNDIKDAKKELKKIDDELLSYRAFLKYKKVFILGVTAIMIIITLQFFALVGSIKQNNPTIFKKNNPEYISDKK